MATRVTQEPAVVLDEFAPDCVTQLLTTRETAEILDVKPGKLENWRSTKRYPRLRFVKIGKNVRYRPDDVAEFLRSGTVGGEAS